MLGSLPVTGHWGPRVSRSIALLFHDLGARMGVGGQHHVPAALPPGKTRYALYRRLGRPQGRSGLVRKISPHTGIRSPDRPVRSESLYRLSYPGQIDSVAKYDNTLQTKINLKKIIWNRVSVHRHPRYESALLCSKVSGLRLFVLLIRDVSGFDGKIMRK